VQEAVFAYFRDVEAGCAEAATGTVYEVVVK